MLRNCEVVEYAIFSFVVVGRPVLLRILLCFDLPRNLPVDQHLLFLGVAPQYGANGLHEELRSFVVVLVVLAEVEQLLLQLRAVPAVALQHLGLLIQQLEVL